MLDESGVFVFGRRPTDGGTIRSVHASDASNLEARLRGCKSSLDLRDNLLGNQLGVLQLIEHRLQD